MATTDEMFAAGVAPDAEVPQAPAAKPAKKQGLCAKCGDQFLLWPKNRKYCGACQALRDLDFRPNLKRKCEGCDTTFYPYRTSFTRCADCSLFNQEREEWPECNQCGKRKRTAPGMSKTCIACVSCSAKAQIAYHKALIKTQLPKQKAWAER